MKACPLVSSQPSLTVYLFGKIGNPVEKATFMVCCSSDRCVG